MSDNGTVEGQLLYIRQFLNSAGHGGLAAVLAEVNEGEREGNYLDFGATLSISDCNRTAVLDFGVYGTTDDAKDRAQMRKEAQNARDKARRLLGAVTAFVAVLNEGLDDFEKELDRRDAEAKEEN